MPQTIGSRLIFPRRRGAGTGNVVSTFINSGLHEADCDKDGAEYMTADSLRATKIFVEEHGEGTFAGPDAVRTRNGCSAVIWRFPQAIPFLVHDQAGPWTKFRY